MYKIVTILFILSFNLLNEIHAQQNFISLDHFYKNHLYYTNHRLEGYHGNSFFPVTESEYDLTQKIADTAKQYYTFTSILFQKHLLEFKGDNYFLTISPTLDFTYARELEDTSNRKLFQNTRGFHIEGDLFKNFSFSTSLYENQSRNPFYQSMYFSGAGEYYINKSDSTYYSQNAVIPGAGRTKPFKGDGFDYGYAIGSIIYQPFKVLTLSAGNNAHFIGDGYRSLLLSDNSYSAPYYQVNYRFLPKWEFVYLRSKLLNLMRRPFTTSVESYYEPKGYAVNYLSFKASKKLTISLFEGAIYSRGDSITSKRVHPLYYNPIPFVSAFGLEETQINAILGLNIGYSPISAVRMYGQFAYNNHSEGLGGQLGVRFSEPFKIKQFFIQLEMNHANNELFASENRRLNYSHFNLPLAHVKGQGFTELVLRLNYEWKRLFVDSKTIYYQLKDYNSFSLNPANNYTLKTSGTILHNQLDLGYRFNRKMNLTLVASWLLRPDSNASVTNVVSIGIRTGLVNHYTDF